MCLLLLLLLLRYCSLYLEIRVDCGRLRLTSSNCQTLNPHLRQMQGSWWYLLCKPRYSPLCFKFCCHGNEDRSSWTSWTSSRTKKSKHANTGRVYILPVWGAKTPGRIEPKFFLVVDVYDIITPFKLGDDRFRGFGWAEGQSLPFSIDFESRPYNTRTNVWSVIWVHVLFIYLLTYSCAE